VESVEIVFDPSKIDYGRLLEVFWHNIDPLTPGGQFCDRGQQYRTAVYFHDDEQRRLAAESKRRVEETLHASVVTEIAPAAPFHPAEKYHQDFYRRTRSSIAVPGQMRPRRRLRELWGNTAGGNETGAETAVGRKR
jgi:peptide-methionine (S)-S-oxide reductase